VALDSIPGEKSLMSPFARRLSEHLAVPGTSIMDVFLDVRAQVMADTHGQQKPEAVMRLNRNLYLAGSLRDVPASAAATRSSAPSYPPAKATRPSETATAVVPPRTNGDQDRGMSATEALCNSVHAGKGTRPKSAVTPSITDFLDGKDAGSLSSAFTWADTPQGHEYWQRQYVLAAAGKSIENDALTALRCWERG
jgi:hypothetical protein